MITAGGEEFRSGPPDGANVGRRTRRLVWREIRLLIDTHVCFWATSGRTHHRDTFDRLIAAQAMIEGLTLVSADEAVATLGAPILW